MKVIFQVNGKSKEVDSKDIKSADDIKMLFQQADSNDTTSTLENLDKAEKLMNETKSYRDEELRKANEKADRITKIYDEFIPTYQQYVQFRKENNITAASSYTSLPEDILIRLNIFEKALAIKWHKIKSEKVHSFLLDSYPQLKPFCRALDATYKQIRQDLR